MLLFDFPLVSPVFGVMTVQQSLPLNQGYVAKEKNLKTCPETPQTRQDFYHWAAGSIQRAATLPYFYSFLHLILVLEHLNFKPQKSLGASEPLLQMEN